MGTRFNSKTYITGVVHLPNSKKKNCTESV